MPKAARIQHIRRAKKSTCAVDLARLAGSRVRQVPSQFHALTRVRSDCRVGRPGSIHAERVIDTLATTTAMASTASLATARPHARSLRANGCLVEKATLLSHGHGTRRVHFGRRLGASRGRTGAVVVEAKIWTDDGRRRAAELMGLTREVRPNATPRHDDPSRRLHAWLNQIVFMFSHANFVNDS